MTISYLFDLYEMFILHHLYEGYIFVVKIFMFDIVVLIPLVILLSTKNTLELKIWSVLSVILQNVVAMLGFKIGAIFAVCIGFLLLLGFIWKYKKFNLIGRSSNKFEC